MSRLKPHTASTRRSCCATALGNIEVVRKHEDPTRHGAVHGLKWGLAIGVASAVLPGIGLLGGLAAGASAGAAIGAVAGHIRGGLDDDDLRGSPTRFNEAMRR